jgi:predicted RNA-binding protein
LQGGRKPVSTSDYFSSKYVSGTLKNRNKRKKGRKKTHIEPSIFGTYISVLRVVTRKENAYLVNQIKAHYVGPVVCTATSIKIIVFCDVTPCSPVDIH